eukprot:s8642_g1.t1
MSCRRTEHVRREDYSVREKSSHFLADLLETWSACQLILVLADLGLGEVDAAVLEAVREGLKEAPGVADAVARTGLASSPLAMLSPVVAGIQHDTLIVMKLQRMDDNFAFVERLLDTLQAESQGSPAQSSGHPVAPEEKGIGSKGPSLQAPRGPCLEPTELTTEGKEESWNEMLSRFCEEGDENIVDSLLDSFLQQKGDVGSMIEEIDRRTALQKKSHDNWNLRLDFGQSLQQPNLDKLEEVLQSASALLSARSCRSHCSTGSARAFADSMPTTAGTVDYATGKHGRLSDLVIEDAESDVQLSSEGGMLGEPCKAQTSHATFNPKEELLAKIASTDSPEEIRNFMRSFLLSLRHRVLMSAVERDVASEDDVQSLSSAGWTCHSMSRSSSEFFQE